MLDILQLKGRFGNKIYTFILNFRLLLWDCDERSYSYFIEVSNNEKDWEVVWDRSKVPCRSWQTITFPRRPIVYIKIVGTYNTANEVFHCVHFECPAVSTCTKSLGNNDQDIEERGGSASSQSSASSEGDEISSSTSDNMQDESNFKRPKQRYVQSVPDNGITNMSYHNASTSVASMPENRVHGDGHNGSRVDKVRNANRGKRRDKRTPHRQPNTRNVSYPYQSTSNRKHPQNDISIGNSSIVRTGVNSEIQSSRASVVTVPAVLDDVASTVANAAEQEEEQQQIFQGAEDEALDTESVAVVDGDLADVNDAETQSQISHHSSPASYAGSISGHSTAGVNANNSLPVGASACSMARQCQQEQFAYKPTQGMNQQTNTNPSAFNLRILAQQQPINDANAAVLGASSSRQHHQSPLESGSPVSSPSSPAPNDQHLSRQSNVRYI